MKKLFKKAIMFLLVSCFLTGGMGCSSKTDNSANNSENQSEETKKTIDELVDFVISADENREFRILQITDLQVIDPGQSRYPQRLNSVTPLSEKQLYENGFYYIEQAVKKTTPDLILFTGDIVYGEFDDDGSVLTKIVAFMEKLNIPWAPVFGNHENESAKGVTWQCNQFINAKNCLFKRGKITGNGNYSIGIKKNGRLIKVIYMMDSNGCSNAYRYSYKPTLGPYNQGEKIRTSVGFAKDQTDWLDSQSAEIEKNLGYSPSKFLACHIPLDEYAKACYENGYQSNKLPSNTETFDIDSMTNKVNGDFGAKEESFSSFENEDLWNILKTRKFDGVFAGHNHINSLSVVYNGIRLTYGLKTGTFDYCDRTKVGGTLILLENESFSVSHCYVK